MRATSIDCYCHQNELWTSQPDGFFPVAQFTNLRRFNIAHLQFQLMDYEKVMRKDERAQQKEEMKKFDDLLHRYGRFMFRAARKFTHLGTQLEQSEITMFWGQLPRATKMARDDL